MRAVLAVGLLIALCTSANAARVHHVIPRDVLKSRNEIIRPSDDAAVPPGWYKFPGQPPIPASENRNLDPSNRGGY